MNSFLSRIIPILAASFATISCGEKESGLRRQKDDTRNFFGDTAPTIEVSSLQNQMAAGQTDLLKSLAGDKIPWQLWDPNILKTATGAQLPIMVMACSPFASTSLDVLKELEASPELSKLLSESAICTIVDTHLNPEIGQLAFHLSNEINRSTAFPMAIWLSHEGLPLAWIPIGASSGKDLERVITGALAMVNNIWRESSDYAVENSRRDHEARQLRFAFPDPSEKPQDTRNERFRKSTRKLSSLYRVGDKDLDYIGGLIPTSSLELLALGSRSGLLTREIRGRCRNASLGIARQIITGALRDPLDQSYFYARMTEDWSLPAFPKNLRSQAEVATMFLKTGSLLEEDKLIREGLNLLEKIETHWLPKNLIALSPETAENSNEGFLWKLETIAELLTPEELALATPAFGLKQEGNIPASADPLGKYFQLNTLRNSLTPDELAARTQQPVDSIKQSLEAIREKLLKARQDASPLFIEETMILADLIAVLQATITRSSCTGTDDDLASAIGMANRLLKEFRDSEGRLLRLKNGAANNATAGAAEHSATAYAFTLLYQRTLDPQWLSLATTIFDRAIETLLADNHLLAEASRDEEIIPLRQHNLSMIFGTSTLGFTDLAAARLHALTGAESYRSILDKHASILDPIVVESIVNHTDYIISCAFGDPPLLALVHGDPANPATQKLLKTLNTPRQLPFLAVRPQQAAQGLAPLPEIPAAGDQPSVLLIRAGKTLGKAETPEALTTLLDRLIATSKR